MRFITARAHTRARSWPTLLPAGYRRLCRATNPFVFAASHLSDNCLGNWGYHKPRLDERLGTIMSQPWVLNDLRRTARTLMSRARVEREHAERALGHTVGGFVEGTYDVYPYLDEKSEALFQLAALLDKILHSGPAPVLNITPKKPPYRPPTSAK